MDGKVKVDVEGKVKALLLSVAVAVDVRHVTSGILIIAVQSKMNVNAISGLVRFIYLLPWPI